MASQLEQVQAGDRVILAFEYGPGSAAELEVASDAVLQQLLDRRALLIAVSSNPAGASQAELMLSKLNAGRATTYGQDYVDLGYVPGGPAAVAGLLSEAQRVAPQDVRGDGNVWTSPILSGLTGLEQAPFILVLTNEMSALQTWAEQVSVLPPDLLSDRRPTLLAIVGSGLAPMAQTYYAPQSGPLKGLVGGLKGADEYEQWIHQSGRAGATREARALPLVMIFALLLVAIVVTGVQRLWSTIRTRNRFRLPFIGGRHA